MEWKMPDLGEGVQEGEIVKWAVKEGDKISHDQHLLEIMTDKATMEIPSPADGTLEKILIKEGEIAKVGQVMAVIATGTEDRRPKTEDQKQEQPPLSPLFQRGVGGISNPPFAKKGEGEAL